MIDSHVNLHGERYADDLSEVIDRAGAAGITAMLAISDRLDHTDEITRIVATYRAQLPMWRSVGVHPHHAKDFADLTSDKLVGMAQADDVVGIGECGLDFYYEYSDRDAQRPVFDAHIDAAHATGLPLIIHSRAADDEMMEALKAGQLRGAFVPLLHCYTSGLDLLRTGLDMGGFVSFSGILSFKKADDVREMARFAPLDRIIIETDCPFLAPVPHRGKRNEPAFLPHVAEALASTKSVPVADVIAATAENFFTLFSKAQRPLEGGQGGDA